MARAQINPQLLTWARERAGLDTADIARKLHVPEDRVLAWEQGDARPTFRQAENYASGTFVPLGYLFLREPPEEDLPIPDLRTVGDRRRPSLSVNLRDTLKDVIRRQLWYREYQQDRDADPVPIVGCMANATTVETIVTSMREQLGVPAHPERGTWEQYFRDLIDRIEALGVLVMRTNIVGTNTHRPLDVDEFRGFAIADPLAPVIFINTADYPPARLFTLIHELTHIWLGESGISDADPDSADELEKRCNAVAAEFLVPEAEFRGLWQAHEDWRHNLPFISAHFHVSEWVIARRARELDFISDDQYRHYVRERLAEHRKRERDGPVPFPTVQKSRIGQRFAQAVASEALSGRLLLRDAHRLTGIKPNKLAEFARKELGL